MKSPITTQLIHQCFTRKMTIRKQHSVRNSLKHLKFFIIVPIYITLLFPLKVLHCKTGALKITSDGRRYTIPQVKLPADSGKNSTGNDCLRFPQVTGGNLLAPAGILPQTFIVRVRTDFSKLGTFPFI